MGNVMALLFIKTNQTKSCPAKDLILPREILLDLTDTSCSFIYIESKRTGKPRMCFRTFCFTMSFIFERKKNAQQFLIKYAWRGREEDLSLWDLIPTEQPCKVEQERRSLLCFVNNSQ